jgi:hypothetical protein
MIGMLGVTALNISSLKSNTFSGNLSEATLIAATKIEELIAMDFDAPTSELFDHDNDGNCHDIPTEHTCAPLAFKNQDGANDDGVDDDGGNFGLDDIDCDGDPTTNEDADYCDEDVGKLGMFTVYWNVAENEPISLSPNVADATQRTKTINVIVEWFVKDEPRRISMEVIRMKE